MNRNSRIRGAAALALVVCLAISPVASAGPYFDGYDFDFAFEVRERVIRVIAKIHKIFGGSSAQEDLPYPPRP